MNFLHFRISRMLLTHLKPVHAREAFPCFDEPDYKTKFQLSVIHENDTTVLSNWDVQVRRQKLIYF